MNRIISAIPVVVAVLLSFDAFAQGAPQIPQKAKELQKLVGNWKGTATLTLPDNTKIPLTSSYECKSASSGYGVSCKLSATVPDGAKYESTDIWGYDAGDGLVHWFTVTSAGETHDHKLNFDNNVMHGQFAGPKDGKLYVETIRFELLSDKKISLRSSVVVGGQQQETFEGVMTK
jgi:hypothetical protein